MWPGWILSDIRAEGKAEVGEVLMTAGEGPFVYTFPFPDGGLPLRPGCEVGESLPEFFNPAPFVGFCSKTSSIALGERRCS